MTKTMSEAFQDFGIRAEYEGDYVTVLPLTAALIEDMGGRGALDRLVRQDVKPGQLVAHMRKDGVSRGLVLNARAENDLSILVRRNDGDYKRVNAGKVDRAYLALVKMAQDARREAKAVAEANEKARADYEVAIDRGDRVDEPVPAVTTYPDGAFNFLEQFGQSVREAVGLRAGARVISIAEKVEALSAQLEIGRANSNSLTREEMERIATERSMREAIGAVNPDHALALRGADQPYTQDPESAREMMASLPLSRAGMRPMGGAGFSNGRDLVQNIFAVMTTTPLSGLQAQPVSPASREAVAQTLGRNRLASWESGPDGENRNGEGQEWAQAALARVGQVLGSAMESYEYRAELYSRDDADVLVISDLNGDYVYAWDSASRVAEFDVEGRILSTYSEADVPSDERLAEVKAALDEVRFDVAGEEIDFGWDDEPEAPQDDAPTPFDIDAGPTR